MKSARLLFHSIAALCLVLGVSSYAQRSVEGAPGQEKDKFTEKKPVGNVRDLVSGIEESSEEGDKRQKPIYTPTPDLVASTEANNEPKESPTFTPLPTRTPIPPTVAPSAEPPPSPEPGEHQECVREIGFTLINCSNGRTGRTGHYIAGEVCVNVPDGCSVAWSYIAGTDGSSFSCYHLCTCQKMILQAFYSIVC